MRALKQSRPELWLLLSLLLVVLLYPLLDRGELRKVILTALTFVPVIIATVRLAEVKGLAWPSVLLMCAAVIFAGLGVFFPNPIILATKWSMLAAFFGFTVVVLFSYLRNARSISRVHLYAAVSVYLLLGMMWFAIYCAVDVISPGSFTSSGAATDRQSELLYFSLVTLTTIGYGDVVARQGEARMLAALEGMVGVLYMAISVAILVSAYRREDSSHKK